MVRGVVNRARPWPGNIAWTMLSIAISGPPLSKMIGPSIRSRDERCDRANPGQFAHSLSAMRRAGYRLASEERRMSWPASCISYQPAFEDA